MCCQAWIPTAAASPASFGRERALACLPPRSKGSVKHTTRNVTGEKGGARERRASAKNYAATHSNLPKDAEQPHTVERCVCGGWARHVALPKNRDRAIGGRCEERRLRCSETRFGSTWGD